MNGKTTAYLKRVALVGVMTALAVICSLSFPMGFTFRVGEFMKFSPIFVVIGITGYLYGWKEAGIVALLSDLIQGLLFGNLSILIALANLLSGIIFGLLLHNKKSVFNITVAVIITQLVCSLGIISAVLFLKFGLPIFPTIYWRILQTAIFIAAEIPVLILLIKVINLPDKLKKIGGIT